MEASAACEALGEQLWSPYLRTVDIRPNLDYLKYKQGSQGSSQYWIASRGTCRQAIDDDGRITGTGPFVRLPVVCTQSALFSNETFKDTSGDWQVTVRSNNEYLTGFRDRSSFRFLRVRYAPQPKRFTYLTLHAANGSQVSALDYGSQCAQGGNVGSEDCLFLNI
ncbi:putative Carboxylic ester hydrolase [Seiridium cardinale]